jgi:soluble lytic murein transglycosylase-like protein
LRCAAELARQLRHGSLPPKTWAQYAGHIQEISRQHGVSAGLIESVIRTESGFDPTAVSPKGAGGLTQLMPQTAAALGVRGKT